MLSDPCLNIAETFTCSCKLGYAINGTLCIDIDKCADGSHNCHPGRAMCTDAVGYFTCSFKSCYLGN